MAIRKHLLNGTNTYTKSEPWSNVCGTLLVCQRRGCPLGHDRLVCTQDANARPRKLGPQSQTRGFGIRVSGVLLLYVLEREIEEVIY